MRSFSDYRVNVRAITDAVHAALQGELASSKEPHPAFSPRVFTGADVATSATHEFTWDVAHGFVFAPLARDTAGIALDPAQAEELQGMCDAACQSKV